MIEGAWLEEDLDVPFPWCHIHIREDEDGDTLKVAKCDPHIFFCFSHRTRPTKHYFARGSAFQNMEKCG